MNNCTFIKINGIIVLDNNITININKTLDLIQLTGLQRPTKEKILIDLKELIKKDYNVDNGQFYGTMCII